MEQDKYFLERKYSKFTENMKLSLKKAVATGNMELAHTINEYLENIKELQYVNTLKEKNDIKVYNDDIKMYEKKLEDLQKNIIRIQFNSQSKVNEDNIVLDIPKYINNDMNYIFMFIYKFFKINSKSMCIILKNFIDDLFNINIITNTRIKDGKTTSTISIEDLCASNILDNISIVYDTKKALVKYIYKEPYSTTTNTNVTHFRKSKLVLNKLVTKINKFNLNNFFNNTENKPNDSNNLLDPVLNVIDDSSNIIRAYSEENKTDTLLDNSNKLEFNRKTNKEFKMTLAILLVNLLKNINCTPKLEDNKDEGKNYYIQQLDNIKKIENMTNEYFNDNVDTDSSYSSISKLKWRSMTLAQKKKYNTKFKKLMDESWEKLSDNEQLYYIKTIMKIQGKSTEKLSKTKLKTQICNYFTFNPEYNIEQEYDLLYNYFLTREVNVSNTIDSDMDMEKKPVENNMNIIIPTFSLSVINNVVLLVYIFIKNNKADICDNILKLLKQIKNSLKKQTYSSYDDGTYYYSQNQILSLCSNKPNAQKLINTFYLKYKEYDKILISNLLLQIIEKDALKIKYDMVEDTFSVVIINKDRLDIDFNEIDQTKLLEGLNNDLKCINEEINKNLIISLIEIIRTSLNKIINIVTDVKLLTSIFNLSTESAKIYSYLKSRNTNFKIRKLLVIMLIKFLITHISKFYKDPYSTEFNMYDTLVNDIHKHICEKLTVEFNYNVFQKLEQLYEEYPNYDI